MASHRMAGQHSILAQARIIHDITTGPFLVFAGIHFDQKHLCSTFFTFVLLSNLFEFIRM